MSIQRLLTGALLCALLPALSVQAKEPRGLQAAYDEVVKALPVQVLVVQSRLRPQYRYNYLDTSQAGVNAGNNLYNGGGIGYGQAMGMGLAGGLIAGAIINGVEKAAARNAVRDPYQLISHAGCDLPLVDSHRAMISGAVQRAKWRGQVVTAEQKLGADEPRYVFTLSTSFAPDFSALMTSIDAQAHAPDANGKTSRKATWQDSLVVVSDGLWLVPKTQADIEHMVAAEQQRYDASGAEALIKKVNAAGSNASRQDRKQALSLAKKHADNMAEAKDEGWSDAGTAMRRAKLWSADNCALLEKTLRSNLDHADGMVQALLGHSLPSPGESPPQPVTGATMVIGSTRPDPQVITATAVAVGLPDAITDGPAPTPVRVMEAMQGGLHVSRLSFENITLGYRHMVLDE